MKLSPAVHLLSIGRRVGCDGAGRSVTNGYEAACVDAVCREVVFDRLGPFLTEFEVVCRLADLGFETTGLGPSRRAAEQQAARAALDRREAL